MIKSELLVINLTGLSKDQLYEKLMQSKKEFFNLRFQHTLGELKNTSRFKIVKKGIARIKTELAKRNRE